MLMKCLTTKYDADKVNLTSGTQKLHCYWDIFKILSNSDSFFVFFESDTIFTLHLLRHICYNNEADASDDFALVLL